MESANRNDSPQSSRRWVNVLLGTGVLASIASFLYPALRYIIPPPVSESTSRSVVAAKVGELKNNSRQGFQVRLRARHFDSDRGRAIQGIFRGLYSSELHRAVSWRHAPDLVSLPQRHLRPERPQRQRSASPAAGDL